MNTSTTISSVNATSLIRTPRSAARNSCGDDACAELSTRIDKPPHAFTGVIRIVSHEVPTANTPTPAMPCDCLTTTIVVNHDAPDEIKVASTFDPLWTS